MRKIIFILAIFTAFSFSLKSRENNTNILIQKAFSGNDHAFGNDYIAGAFAYWQHHLKLDRNSPTFQIRNSNFNNNEVQIHSFSGLADPDYGIVLTIKTIDGVDKIVDVRRLLYPDVNSFKKEEQDLIQFLEKLFWLYDTGNQNLLKSFFFHDFAILAYKGQQSTDDIISLLKKEYKILPGSNISWEKRNDGFYIRIYPKSAPVPLEITLDLRKYKTIQLNEKTYKIQELVDSLTVWKNDKNDINKICEKTASIPEAINQVIAKHFVENGYQIKIKQTGSDFTIFEAIMPPYEKFPGFPLRYYLFAEPYVRDGYCIKSNIDFRFQQFEKVKDYYRSVLGLENANQEKNLLHLIEKNIYTYSTLRLPTVFQPVTDNETPTMQNSIHVHHMHIDSIHDLSYTAIFNILRNVTQNHNVYYLFEKVSRNQGQVELKGHSIWKNNELLMHHYAIILEKYTERDDEYNLASIHIDLYPFLRDDNVESLFTIGNLNSKKFFEIYLDR